MWLTFKLGFIDMWIKLSILHKWINLEALLKKVKTFEIELLFATVPEWFY